MTERELDELLTFRWPMVVRRAVAVGNEWEAGFAKSIARHGKRKNWRPTYRQAQVMRRMVEELTAAPEPEFDLIEE
ncbi:hypothetical protein EU805_09110 [Salipiger sp. IMCC34102]|uniref:hypothetical protein n=1 Tax=Salipiger sp. IMCC34102 TaxID=2510647 RepID=UPI00101DE754|nr:hypothetical protein [Salipiger sp. IMCC34102]RYH02753.1 hypothetical protein EU805_09110 [Salipiger sp. IMCC34102]